MSKEYLKSNDTLTSFDEKADLCFRAAINLNHPIAIWKNTSSDHTHIAYQLSNIEYLIESIESAHSGFVFGAFEKSKAKKYIKADVVLSSETNQFEVSPTFTDSETVDKFNEHLNQLNLEDAFDYTAHINNLAHEDISKSAYLSLVSKSIDAIQSGGFQKIVPSRTKPWAFGPEFNPLKEFNKLCEAYANAFVSLVYIPNEGMWLGATPELLISVDDKKQFKTVALAGTQAIPEAFQLSKAAWTQKDIEEQALVSRYIINCFKKIRLREFEEYGPKTVKAANLIHLKTEFKVDMEAVNFAQLGTVMLDLLHPTSAVCGMPMEASAVFLANNEGYDRSYYAGFLGPVNFKSETNIFVNLRCMQIMKDHAVLYAGGGVTEDSEPESEWLETEMKFNTLLNILNT
jgi:isochorismate synthase